MSEQGQKWAGDAGVEYTERNPHTVKELETLRREQYGLTQSEIYRDLLVDVDRDAEILEVGSNVGVQLRCLRQLGFENVVGLDVQSYAIAKSREYSPDIPAFVGDASRLPFKDDSFDLVFTNGCLVAIPPDLLADVQSEIVRCSREYVLGSEFYADKYVEIDSDHDEQLYWKTDFRRHYRENHDLETVQSRYLHYEKTDNRDEIFLLRNADAQTDEEIDSA